MTWDSTPDSRSGPESLDIFDRALIDADPATLTDSQLARREKLLEQLGESRADIERRRVARRDGNRLATRLAGHLGIHHLLTPAPARAWFELIRKFAKDHAAGREPVYDQPRECLAGDAGISATAFDTMRRIAVKRGWIIATVQRVQAANGHWRQEPTLYQPGPLAWKAIALLMRTDRERAEAPPSPTGSQKIKRTVVSNYIYPSLPRSVTASGPKKSGDAARRRCAPKASGKTAGSLASAPPAASSHAGSTTGKTRPPGGTLPTNGPRCPPQIADTEALRAILQDALAAEEAAPPAPATDAALIEACDRLRLERCPEISDSDWSRAVRARGLWAAISVLVVLAKQARIRSPGGTFAWWCWHAVSSIDDPAGQACATLRIPPASSPPDQAGMETGQDG
jgi:hypothetical protein